MTTANRLQYIHPRKGLIRHQKQPKKMSSHCGAHLPFDRTLHCTYTYATHCPVPSPHSPVPRLKWDTNLCVLKLSLKVCSPPSEAKNRYPPSTNWTSGGTSPSTPRCFASSLMKPTECRDILMLPLTENCWRMEPTDRTVEARVYCSVAVHVDVECACGECGYRCTHTCAHVQCTKMVCTCSWAKWAYHWR